jgi:hypothetical protein
MDREQATGAQRASRNAGAGRHASSTASRARGIGFGLAAAIALCCALLAPAVASAAPELAAVIEGHVVESSGSAVANTEVCADSEALEVDECALTNEFGDYKIDVPGSEYVVEFTGEVCTPECTRPYARQYYEGKSIYSEATRIAISSGQTRSSMDAVLEPGAVIEGHVVESKGEPVANMVVCAIRESEQECTATNGGGDYKIEGLAAGEYRVEFNGAVCVANTCKHTYAEQFYEDAPEYASARPLTLQAGETAPGIDATLELGDSIAGTVNGSDGTSGIVVCASPRAETGSGQSCAEADESGDYEIEGLAEGEYTVFFQGRRCEPDGSCTQPYVSQYYEDVSEEAKAKGIVLSGHGVAAIDVDATLELAGSIEGTVSASGAPVPRTRVCAEAEDFAIFQCEETDAEGKYEIEGLRPGEYVVEFSGEVCSDGEVYECDSPYVAQYWEDKSEFATADPITVKGGLTSEAIDATLAPGGQIDGTVTNAALGKPPVAGLEICAYERSTGIDRCAHTDSAGDYAIEGLASGSYVVEFDGEVCGEHGCAEEYLRQFYQGASEEADAKSVEVDAPAAVTGIDASMSESKPKAPGVLAAPTLTGAAAVGATLTCSEGSFSNDPTRLAYEWLRDGAPIPGASASSYVVQEADEGHALACEVSAFNAAGSASAMSNTLAIPAKAGTASPAPEVAHGSAVARGTATEKKGRVLLQLICTGSGPCSGEVVLVASVRQKRGKHHRAKVEKLTIGKARFSLPAGAKQTLAVKLTPKGKALIAGAGKHGTTVQLSGSDLASRILIVKASSEKKKKKKKKKKG